MLPNKENNTHTLTMISQSFFLVTFASCFFAHRTHFGSQPIKWWTNPHNILPCLLSGRKSSRSPFLWQKWAMETLQTSKALHSCSCMSRGNGDGCKQQVLNFHEALESDSTLEKCTVQGWITRGLLGTWAPPDFSMRKINPEEEISPWAHTWGKNSSEDPRK